MRIQQPRHRIVCECGACKNQAAYTVVFEKLALSRAFNICNECAHELGELLCNPQLNNNTDKLNMRNKTQCKHNNPYVKSNKKSLTNQSAKKGETHEHKNN